MLAVRKRSSDNEGQSRTNSCTSVLDRTPAPSSTNQDGLCGAYEASGARKRCCTGSWSLNCPRRPGSPLIACCWCVTTVHDPHLNAERATTFDSPPASSLMQPALPPVCSPPQG